MQHSLNQLVTHPALPLAHRLRSPLVQPGASDGVPCLILLHGVGANETNLIDVAQRQDPRLLVILARGPLVFGPAQFGWFNVSFASGGPMIDAQQAELSRAMLARFIEGLPAAYDVDPHRVWIAGFSQGGIMSASVGLTRPDRVAGFGILSGRILPEIAPITAPNEQTRKLSAFISHGVNDGKLTVEFARSARRLLEQKEVRLDYHEYDAAHELNAVMQGDFDAWLKRQLDASQA
jgi:phospholipase/carboxylesterase